MLLPVDVMAIRHPFPPVAWNEETDRIAKCPVHRRVLAAVFPWPDTSLTVGYPIALPCPSVWSRSPGHFPSKIFLLELSMHKDFIRALATPRRLPLRRFSGGLR
jgi:hypothetical protein